MRHGYKKLIGGVFILLMIALSLAYPLTALAQSSDETSGAQKSVRGAELLAAKMYVNRVSLLINRTLEVAEENNITIPDNLTSHIDHARELLQKARDALEEGNASLAVRYATQASQEFMKVSIYVWTHLSTEARQNLEQEKVINAIEARLAALHHLELIVDKLKDAGVNTSRLETIILQVNETLNNALELARQGNITGAKILLAHATKDIGEAMRATLKTSHKSLHAAVATAAAIRRTTGVLHGITMRLNETIQYIENGSTDEALTRLYKIEDALTTLTAYLTRVHEVMVERNISEVYVNAVELLLNATNTSTVYINDSIASLEANDTNASIMYIGMAVDVLSTAIDSLKEAKLPNIVIKQVKELKITTMKARGLIKWNQAKMYAALSMHLDKEKVKLEILLHQYQEGKIPKIKLVREALHTYKELIVLKHSLGPNAPDWLLKKIDNLQEWIKTNIPEAVHG